MVTPSDIEKIIGNLRNTQSMALDGHSTKLYKTCAKSIAGHISNIVNMSFHEGKVPDKLKVSRVTPVHKGGDKNDLSNYRPISVIPVMGKIFEGVVAEQLTKFLQTHHVLSPCQYGFRPKSSTETAVFDLVSSVQSARDIGHAALAIFVDVKKAFDAVVHACMMRSLAFAGILGKSRDWLEDYLRGRSQVVSSGGCTSESAICETGVPQGSRLGPILFTLFINSLASEDLFAQIYMYAEDVCLLYTGDDPRELTAQANQDLLKILSWAKCNKVTINTEKTKYMTFGRGDEGRTLRYGDTILQEVTTFRYLGIIIDCDLNFEAHMEHLISRLSAVTGAIRRSINQSVTTEMRRMLYFAMCHSLLLYGAILSLGEPP
ncbi:hypothetical protein DMENIID0001_043480 [Sergentomyia squamirostris]